MPTQNRFCHQNYPTQPAVPPSFHKLSAAAAADGQFSGLHTDFGVREVIVVHGTFMGEDSFAVADVLETIADGAPLLQAPLSAVAERIRERLRPMTNWITQDIGNYTNAFCSEFQRLVGHDPAVRLLNPTWSGQNHHQARADLAVRLLCRLNDLQPGPDERILLWGHSHAGNGFALLSNLLANEPAAVRRFFDAAGPRSTAHWEQARAILDAAPTPHPWASRILIASFGTPVRYGWDSDGYKQLLHVLHHRNYDPDNRFCTRPMYPPHSMADTLSARYGDWVQAFAIAGTDIVPPTAQSANEALNVLLEAGLKEPEHDLDTRFILPRRVGTACARWKTGTRCHADGQNLLVEYEPCGRLTPLGTPIEESILGHGVATTIDWLPAHLDLVLNALPVP
ncbi:MAG: hypothetical protein RIK87_24385 [Fuerstiella sp.]